MRPERWHQIDKLFQVALTLKPEDRAAFLDHACEGDFALRREVESLLASHARAGSFLSSPAVEDAAPLLADDKPDFLVHRSFGPYRVLSLIDAGGMGEVYLAEDTRLRRKVALKLLLPSVFIQDEWRLNRFKQEAQAASALNHPNIITIHDIGQADDGHFMAMEFVEGETLRQRLAESVMSLSQSLDIAIQTASALTAAHQAGIVHRDIKPENIMLRPDGLVKVLDFGLVKLTEGHSLSASTLTISGVDTDPGTLMGTANYMSPEQARKLEVDARSDIFSLGVVIYEMLAGRPPFKGNSTSDVIAFMLEKEAVPLSHYLPEAPARLQWILSKALRKEREERYQTAKELLGDLTAMRDELQIQTKLELSAPSHMSREEGELKSPRVSSEQAKTATAREKIVQRARTSTTKYLSSRPNRHKAAALLALAIVMIALAVTILDRRRSSKPKEASGEVSIRSIAVLPFKPLLADNRDESLEMGLADTLIFRLSGIRKIIVRPISAVRKYADLNQDPLAAGREQQVEAVLDSTIQKVGQKVRVTSRLIRVEDGSVLWTHKSDEPYADLLALQDSIAAKLAGSLTLKLTSEEKQRLTKRYTENPEAYELYLKGRYHCDKRTLKDLKRSIEYFDQAVRKDPIYALAHAGLADCYDLLSWLGGLPPKEASPKARVAATRALEIDEMLAEAHTSLAHVKLFYDWDWSGAERELKRAIEINPNYATARQLYAMSLSAIGRQQEAVAEIKKAQELNPLSLIINDNLGWIFYFGGQYDRAIEQYQKTLDLDPNFVVSNRKLREAYAQKRMFREALAGFPKIIDSNGAGLALVGYVYGKLGKRAEAQKVINELKELSRQRYISGHYISQVYLVLGEKDQAFVWLERAYQDRSGNMVLMKVDPMFSGLHSEPQFQDLLRRIGLSP